MTFFKMWVDQISGPEFGQQQLTLFFRVLANSWTLKYTHVVYFVCFSAQQCSDISANMVCSSKKLLQQRDLMGTDGCQH